MTMRFWTYCGLAAFAAGSAGSAFAQETGLSDIHDQRRESNRICMVDHFHSGASSGRPTRKNAEVAAIANWADFTVLEYGPPWGRYTLAGSKTMTCVQESGSWGCSVEARPCKLAGSRQATGRKKAAEGKK
ncbi:MAG: hypothetical protein ACREC6_09855 [Hyphomicrobiaceae bacterium]